MFCPKCGGILVPKKENGKKFLVCSCGYKTRDVKSARIREVVKSDEEKVEVLEREDIESLPLTEAECPKCGNRKAYYWLVQTRSADEPETRFFRCQKCKYTWREYG